MLRLPLLLCLSLLTSGVFAQQLSLEELTEKALTHNLDVRSSQLEQQITESRIKEVKSSALPQVNFAGDYKYYIKIPAQVIPLSAFGGPEGAYSAAAFGLPWNLGSTVQANQVIYNPGIMIGLKAAKVGREVSELQIRRTKEDIAYNVAVSYYNAQTLAQQVKFLEGNIEALDRSIRITDLQFQNQLGKGIDVDRLRLNKVSMQTQIESLKADYIKLVSLLKFLAGISQQDELTINNTIQEATVVVPNSQESGLNRTELLLLDRQQFANTLEQKNIKAGFLPTVSAYGVANHNVFAIGGDQSYLKGIPAYWLGLQINWNIFDGYARRHKLSQKQLEGQQLSLNLQKTKESISMDITNARTQMSVQNQNLKTSEEQVKLAQKVYEQTQLQFKEGTIDISNLIQTENALREAQNNFLTSLVKLRTAELDWKKATGNLITQ
ncbi:TolC family protein [Siphonobacter sp. SORGH_AS_0500]|uniref:TolC family protein n=1 Tax=Siphonobacter sp. SORGH_AS_0500 TaxID=1864824 RepID=UPI0028674EA1|nr:TolC family protein [Siphonobacter sp. SORGH_AS_0500]MDR6196015.1 outer membrane protein [Siphonobacter sp. SORGH_AS_0500]